MLLSVERDATVIQMSTACIPVGDRCGQEGSQDDSTLRYRKCRCATRMKVLVRLKDFMPSMFCDDWVQHCLAGDNASAHAQQSKETDWQGTTVLRTRQ